MARKKKKSDFAARIDSLWPANSIVGILVYDKEGRICYANRFMAGGLNISVGSSRCPKVQSFIHADIGSTETEIRRMLQNGGNGTCTIPSHVNPANPRTFAFEEMCTGMPYVLEVHPFDTGHMIALFRPIFNRTYRFIGQLSSDAIVTVDQRGRILSFSELFQWMTGLDRIKLFGKPLNNFFRTKPVEMAFAQQRKMVQELTESERANVNSWQELFNVTPDPGFFKSGWKVDQDTRISRCTGGVTIDNTGVTGFLAFGQVLDHFRNDLRWEAEVSFNQRCALGFFFNGTMEYSVSSVGTPDIDGYLVTIHRGFPNGMPSRVFLKRWCNELVQKKISLPAGKNRMLLAAEKVGGIFRFFVNGRRVLEYADPNFIRYGLSFHSGLLVSAFPLNIYSLKLLQRKSLVNYAAQQPRNFDVVFRNRPDQVFEAEIFNRGINNTLVRDVYLRRVTELRKTQREKELLLQHKELALGQINQELKIASSVLNRLLPQEFPKQSGITFESYYQPSGIVGGDLYDVFVTENGQVIILLYDVSGHGVPAALVSVMFKTLFQKHFNEKKNLLEQLSLINSEVYKTVGEADLNLEQGMFITLFYGRYDPATRVLTYVGAGMPSPLVLQTEGLTLLHTKGLPLGINSTLNSSEQSVVLQPGTKVVMFTDGLYEIFNTDGALYGSPRMVEFIKARQHLPLKEMFKQIIEEQKSYIGNVALKDDVSMLGMEIETVS
ncbi:MAG: hypothetical protein A2268_11405 [Candidatus Raymondbacteria bacterium RifOxyA12_full_50_37]|uniref:PPM-type phosphatase domain-containing protein n=1 Tax=Candidatus Raymondbacteria bacterium RIFOXYD12_FULL_49_13 TaxID=1817890 RepID=A0A1F7FAE7_UNCRA|nr:MAG: hypothetical protein A2268_11405 [Candidatus Raymondbacteria bacterium RifOxyA12_full_50_37]OGJ92375.1 MAG: hypothetical protein A2248_10530 [Candidatus Raymondbacteria bacterium RIFOXYA2_FULL_49_16]OGJ99356.1 MAG: hypothetical protein A2453_13590 [Candidatus Raymondbacteria bacterium RIFOXYC2_FULL_50_21]OGK01065.1 MAG: hypothetical protein A2350_01115 [Candidatus Raymondbacteria bacterium RifOxyB12_full_50_8]OGK02677.1 MAG: hypothetical protein A2487_00960 [Candidatus Raymondbacteria b